MNKLILILISLAGIPALCDEAKESGGLKWVDWKEKPPKPARKDDPFKDDEWDGWVVVQEPERLWAEEVALKSEFGKRDSRIIQWTKCPTLSIFNMSEKEKDIVKQVVVDLNNVLSKTQIQLSIGVDNDENADVLVKLLSNEDFISQSKRLCADAYDESLNGFVYVWQKNYEIHKGFVLLNKDKLKDDHLVHVTYEEITQSLGFLNDSMIFKDSIFYQGDSSTTSLSELDKKLISFSYIYLSPGDNAEKFDKQFNQHFEFIKKGAYYQ